MTPALFDGGQLILELLADEPCEALKVVLASVPTDRGGPVVHLTWDRQVT
jgi:hypothetical protein